MKNSAHSLRNMIVAAFALCGLSGVTACRRTDKPVDVAQDSILVRDADTAQKATSPSDTLPTVVKQRGTAAPTLTPGSPGTSPSGITPAAPRTPPITNPRMPPPSRPHPPVILPGRDSTVTRTGSTAIALPPPPPPPAPPPPPPPAKPPTDTGRDTLNRG